MMIPQLPWEFWGLLASLLLAVQITLNQHYTLAPMVLGASRAVFALLLGFPLLFMIPANLPLIFYAGAILVGILGQTADLLIFRAAGIHGGRLTSMYQPMKIWFIFIAWFIISGTTRNELLASPLTLIGVVIMLLIGTYGIITLRKSDASLQALPSVIPIAILFTVSDIVASSTLTPERIIPFIAILLVVQNSLSLAILPFCKHKSELKFLRTWLVGLIAGIIWLGIVLAAIACLEAVPNPAYFSVFALLSIVWIFAYNRLRGIAPRVNWWAVLLILASAAGVALLR